MMGFGARRRRPGGRRCRKADSCPGETVAGGRRLQKAMPLPKHGLPAHALIKVERRLRLGEGIARKAPVINNDGFAVLIPWRWSSRRGDRLWRSRFANMIEDPLHRGCLGNEGHHPHLGPAHRAGQGKGLVDARQQQRPQIAGGGAKRFLRRLLIGGLYWRRRRPENRDRTHRNAPVQSRRPKCRTPGRHATRARRAARCALQDGTVLAQSDGREKKLSPVLDICRLAGYLAGHNGVVRAAWTCTRSGCERWAARRSRTSKRFSSAITT